MAPSEAGNLLDAAPRTPAKGDGMKRLQATLAGAALVATIGATAPAMAKTPTLAVTAFFVDAQCLGGDVARVRLTAVATAGMGEVRFRWDFQNDGSFDSGPRVDPRVQHPYGDELNITARVGARDASGATAQDIVSFTTPRCEG